ncbi:MAG: exodeoxyribonuclease VII small subunit [Clostridiales bacterium]|nr:exodeoxyribonuclease VII small subunit [Clostridiales bacterium]
MKFEERIASLEEIAKKIENDNLSLEESIKLYEDGIKTARECVSYLNENKEKINNLTKQMEELFAGEDNEL